MPRVKIDTALMRQWAERIEACLLRASGGGNIADPLGDLHHIAEGLLNECKMAEAEEP